METCIKNHRCFTQIVSSIENRLYPNTLQRVSLIPEISHTFDFIHSIKYYHFDIRIFYYRILLTLLLYRLKKRRKVCQFDNFPKNLFSECNVRS